MVLPDDKPSLVGYNPPCGLSGVKGPEGLCHQKQEETPRRKASSPLRRDADAMLKHAIAWLHVAHLVMGVVQAGGGLQRCE